MKNITKQNWDTIILWALILFFSFLVMSCGARKAVNTKTEEVVKTESSNQTELDKKEESNVKKTENIVVNDKDETIIKETTYEPIDPAKPASVVDSNGQKTDLYNSKRTTKETIKRNNTKTDIAKVSNEKIKSEVSAKQKSNIKSEGKKIAKAKEVVREKWSALNLLWLLILVPVYLVWKNKTKIAGWIAGLWWV